MTPSDLSSVNWRYSTKISSWWTCRGSSRVDFKKSWQTSNNRNRRSFYFHNSNSFAELIIRKNIIHMSKLFPNYNSNSIESSWERFPMFTFLLYCFHSGWIFNNINWIDWSLKQLRQIQICLQRVSSMWTTSGGEITVANMEDSRWEVNFNYESDKI